MASHGRCKNWISHMALLLMIFAMGLLVGSGTKRRSSGERKTLHNETSVRRNLQHAATTRDGRRKLQRNKPPPRSVNLPRSLPFSAHPGGFTIARGSFVGTVALPSSYVLSFDLMPMSTVDASAWREIILLTATDLPPSQRTIGNDGSSSCSRYCAGVSGASWNSELPSDWGGAICLAAGRNNDLSCSSTSQGSPLPCLCQASPLTPWANVPGSNAPYPRPVGRIANPPWSRLPAVLFCGPGSSRCPVRGLNVAFTASTSDAVFASTARTSRQVEINTAQALPANQWSTVTIRVDSVNLVMTLTVSGAISIATQSVNFPAPFRVTWPSVKVYTSDPWFPAAAASIRNLAISLPSPATRAAETRDGDVLCAFYSSVPAGPGKTALTNWCGPKNAAGAYVPGPCSTTSPWSGITCTNGRVTRLNLMVCNPLGGGPVQRKALGGGRLPASLGNLAALTFLGMNCNSISGSLPASISALTALQTLYLGFNSISGTVPSLTLTKLRQFILFNNQISGTLPSFSGLTALELLRMGTNLISGTLPPSLSALTDLTWLGFGTNRISGKMLDLSRLTKLQHLWLDFNRLMGPIPASACNLPATVSFKVSNQTGPGLTCFPACLSRYRNFQKGTSLTRICNAGLPSSLPTRLPTRVSRAAPGIGKLLPVQYAMGGPISILRSQMLGEVILPAQYSVSFDFVFFGPGTWRAAPIPADWTGILQLCRRNDQSSNLPTLMINPHAPNRASTQAQLFLAYSGMTGSGITTPQIFRVGTATGPWMSLAIQIDQIAGIMRFLLPGAPTQAVSVPVSRTGVGGGIQVWVAGPWGLPTNGQLRRLNIVNSVQTRSPSTAPTRTPTMIRTNAPASRAPLQTASRRPSGTLTSTAAETRDGDVLCAWFSSVTNKGKLTNWCPPKVNGAYVPGPCSIGASAWRGVTCSAGRRVTSLNFPNQGLGGSLPATLGNLDALTSLGLWSNSLSGTLPNLSRLTKLQDIRLDQNSISGTFPSLSGLTALTWVALFRNRISGTLPSLSGLTNLRALILDQNRLTGPIPASACSLRPAIDFRVFGQTGRGLTCYPQCLSANSNFMQFKGSLTAVCNAAPSVLTTRAPAARQTNAPLLGARPSTRPSGAQRAPTLAPLLRPTRSPAAMQRTNAPAAAVASRSPLQRARPSARPRGAQRAPSPAPLMRPTRSPVAARRSNAPAAAVASRAPLQSLNSRSARPSSIFRPTLVNRPIRYNETSDADVLCAWYNSAPTSGQAKLTNWCGPKSPSGAYSPGPCSTTSPWLAVFCTGGRVTSISTWFTKALVVGDIGGTLPSNIGNLDALTYFALYANGVSGSLPLSLFGLTALQVLVLQGNSITGSLASLSSLTLLTYLDLSFNRMTGPIPASICSLPSYADIRVQRQSDPGFSCYPSCLSSYPKFIKDASLTRVCCTGSSSDPYRCIPHATPAQLNPPVVELVYSNSSSRPQRSAAFVNGNFGNSAAITATLGVPLAPPLPANYVVANSFARGVGGVSVRSNAKASPLIAADSSIQVASTAAVIDATSQALYDAGLPVMSTPEATSVVVPMRVSLFSTCFAQVDFENPAVLQAAASMLYNVLSAATIDSLAAAVMFDAVHRNQEERGRVAVAAIRAAVQRMSAAEVRFFANRVRVKANRLFSASSAVGVQLDTNVSLSVNLLLVASAGGFQYINNTNASSAAAQTDDRVVSATLSSRMLPGGSKPTRRSTVGPTPSPTIAATAPPTTTPTTLPTATPTIPAAAMPTPSPTAQPTLPTASPTRRLPSATAISTSMPTPSPAVEVTANLVGGPTIFAIAAQTNQQQAPTTPPPTPLPSSANIRPSTPSNRRLKRATTSAAATARTSVGATATASATAGNGFDACLLAPDFQILTSGASSAIYLVLTEKASRRGPSARASSRPMSFAVSEELVGINKATWNANNKRIQRIFDMEVTRALHLSGRDAVIINRVVDIRSAGSPRIRVFFTVTFRNARTQLNTASRQAAMRVIIRRLAGLEQALARDGIEVVVEIPVIQTNLPGQAPTRSRPSRRPTRRPTRVPTRAPTVTAPLSFGSPTFIPYSGQLPVTPTTGRSSNSARSLAPTSRVQRQRVKPPPRVSSSQRPNAPAVNSTLPQPSQQPTQQTSMQPTLQLLPSASPTQSVAFAESAPTPPPDQSGDHDNVQTESSGESHASLSSGTTGGIIGGCLVVVILAAVAYFVISGRKEKKDMQVLQARHLADLYLARGGSFTPYVTDRNSRNSRSSFSRQSFAHTSPLAGHASMPRSSINGNSARHHAAAPVSPDAHAPPARLSVSMPAARQSFRAGANLALQVQGKQQLTDSGRRRLASQRLSIAPHEAL